MNDRTDPRQPSDGLCATCRHARIVVTDRGSRFVHCGRSAVDPRFPKYPRLPVLRCAGYDASTEQGTDR